MTKIILTRHGHVEGITPERFRGRTQLTLTDLGHAQAKAVAARIAAAWNVAIVYTSPMGRCVETGKGIATACGAASDSLETLNDLDYGQWRWRTYDEVRKASPDQFNAWRTTPHLVRFPEGESFQDLVARTADALRLVLERHASQTVVLVGHDSVNRALLLQLLDQPLLAYWRIAQDPCSINEIDIIDGCIYVRRINETLHLEGLG